MGRVFWVGALVELTGRPIAEVRDALGRLRVKELVVPHDPSSFRDEQEFAFRHGLIRDGAYDSLPKTLRADKHLGVARWAADRAGDRVEEIAELIATHEVEAIGYLDELGDRRPEIERQALAHAWAAARRTRALKLAAESTRWFREAERLADRLAIPPADRAPLAREHAAATIGPDGSDENERVARRAIEIFAAIDDRDGVGWASARLVIPLMQQSRHDEAEQAGRTAIETLEPLGDSADLADALHQLGRFLWRRGREPEAEPLLRRAIDIAARVDAKLVRAEATQTLAVCQISFGTLRRSSPAHGGGVHPGQGGRRQHEPHAGLQQRRRLSWSASPGPRRRRRSLREGLELALRSGNIQNGGWIAGSLGDTLLAPRPARGSGAASAPVPSTWPRRAADAPLDRPAAGVAGPGRCCSRGRVDEARRAPQRGSADRDREPGAAGTPTSCR